MGVAPQQPPPRWEVTREFVEALRRARVGVDRDARREREWRCAYCQTVFVEQRCPTCGAGREEGGMATTKDKE